jgi:hypothetical protein
MTMACIQFQEIFPKWLLTVMNNLYEIEGKLTTRGDPGNAVRNVERIREAIAASDFKLFYEDPFGKPFKETRTDLEASISGTTTENLVVTEVIKPIIRYGGPERSKVVQKGIVVVESRNEENSE